MNNPQSTEDSFLLVVNDFCLLKWVHSSKQNKAGNQSLTP